MNKTKIDLTTGNSETTKENSTFTVVDGVKTVTITKPAKVSAFEYQDYTGKPLYYLRIEIDGKEPLTLNVGLKTIQKIKTFAE